MNYSFLVEKAREAMKYAYAPYSNFKVGAALLTESGNIYVGCNIENISFGATNCAERTAVFKAVSEGEKNFKAIAIVSSSGKFTPPCGICRQVLSEFSEDMDIILADKEDNIKIIKLNELIPFSFDSIN